MWFATYLPLSVGWHIWETITPNCNWGSSLLNLLESKQMAYRAHFKTKQKCTLLSIIYIHKFIDIKIASYFSPKIKISPQEREKKMALWWRVLLHHIYSTAASALFFVYLYYLVPKMNPAWIGKYKLSKNHSKKVKQLICCGRENGGLIYRLGFQCKKKYVKAIVSSVFLFWK